MFPILIASLALAADPAPAAAPSQPGQPLQAMHMRRRVFLSPMGEPFRTGQNGVESDPLQAWFDRVDANHDGALSADEMRKDADRFYATLDMDRDGEIAPVELTRYETEVAPEIQMGPRSGGGGDRGEWSGGPPPGEGPGGWGGGRGHRGGGRAGGHGFRAQDNGLQGAGRYSLLNIPEPVAAADADLNRGISLPEFERASGARFLMLDSDHDGKLTLPELRAIQQANEPPLPKGKDKKERRRTVGQDVPTDG